MGLYYIGIFAIVSVLNEYEKTFKGKLFKRAVVQKRGY
jgi:hypothetical protein